MTWREMTDDELAGLPEARLGGALLWMVTAAAILCIGALIVIMTLLRLRVTPVVASLGFLAWIAYRFAAALLSHAGWPLMVDLVGEALLAAGFCGYMAGGVRPNAYYRRRLPAP